MFRKLSLQSKLTLILLAVSISSILTIAFVGYRSGRLALKNSISNQLTSLRFSTSQEIEGYFTEVRGGVKTLAQNPAVIDAMKSMNAAYNQLKTQPISPNFAAPIETYYRDKFIPKLEPAVQGVPQVDTYKPVTAAQQYLQYHYTIKSDDFDELAAIEDAGDGSDYSKIHKTIHPFLRDYTDEFQHEDLFLIDVETGEVIYSVFKGIDFTASLETGFLRNSVLAEAYEAVIKERTAGFVAIADYQPYAPSHNTPAAIIASPIFDGGTMIGVLAIQVSSAPIDAIMTHDKEWKKVGLGSSGETYLIGPDLLLRSNSRFLLETPKEYYQALRNSGINQATIEEIQRLESSILIQPVKTESAQLASRGRMGTHIINDYRDVSVLSSYAPLNVSGLQWSVLAELDETEAFAPIARFQKQVFITTATIVLLITVIALVLAQLLVRPIRALQEGFTKIGEGRMDTEVHVNTGDEFHDLAQSFNKMVKNLKNKTVLLNQKSQENEELLLSILPSPVAKRLKTGEETIADSHANVTILFAEVIGFSSLSRTMDAEASVTLLNQLVTAFDDALERYGVEKIKTMGSGYMAVGGLSVVRLDHSKRVVDFGLDMIRVVQMFNTKHNTDLKLQIGIHAGAVVAGIVGKSKFIYDLWGDAVSVAHDLKTSGIPDSIHVSDTIYRQLKEFYAFEPSPFEETGQDESLTTWHLSPER